jgi:hypothetical protein
MCPESGTRLALFTEVCGLPIRALSQIFRPFRAGRSVDMFLGLKPQAESFCPFGAVTEYLASLLFLAPMG